jgi:hypothetical protein
VNLSCFLSHILFEMWFEMFEKSDIQDLDIWERLKNLKYDIQSGYTISNLFFLKTWSGYICIFFNIQIRYISKNAISPKHYYLVPTNGELVHSILVSLWWVLSNWTRWLHASTVSKNWNRQLLAKSNTCLRHGYVV